MNILAILYCYPPFLFPATMCYLKLLAGLKAHGFGVIALTLDPESYGKADTGTVDETLYRFIPEGIEQHKVWSREAHPVYRMLKRTDAGYRLFYRLFEPSKEEWVSPAGRYLERIPPDRYDLILSCSQPHANHLIGLHLKQKTGKPWIAYFSDPWSDNPYGHYLSERIRAYNAECEAKVMERADMVLFTSGEMRRYVTEKYQRKVAEKSGVLPHSFIPEWYALSGIRCSGNEKKKKIRIIHTGHFYGPRTPMPFFSALARLNKEMSVKEIMEIYFYGAMDKRYDTFISDHSLDDFLKIRDTIPYMLSLGLMRDADYLLLIDAPLPPQKISDFSGTPLRGTGESIFLPSKLIDYIGSCRPVVGITPERGASSRVLRESGNLTCDVHDGEAIYRLLKGIAERSVHAIPDKAGIDGYHYMNVAAQLKAMICSAL